MRAREPTPLFRAGSEGIVDDTTGWLLGLLGRFAPQTIGSLEAEIDEKLAALPNPTGEFGYDPWGFRPQTLRNPLLLLAILYRYYFRVRMEGIENFPEGRVLVIANHAGQLPFDGAMLLAGAILEPRPPRLLRAMAEYWMPTLPFIGTMGTRMGSVVGTPENCQRLLRREEAVVAFPEGVRGLNKTWDRRYKLQEFGLGFMRLALATDTPILPVTLIGTEEQAPAFANVPILARLLGAPAFPVTPTFPLLGPLGLLPLPVKYHVTLGPLMQFHGDPHAGDRRISQDVDRVRSEMARMMQESLRRRPGVFL